MKVDKDLKFSCEQIKKNLIEDIIPITRYDAILDMEPFPSPLELATLAKAVYTDGLVSLPDGWKYLTTAFNNSWGNGYYGAAYWKPSLQQVVIAHRGTKPTNTGALWTNYNSVVGAEYSSQMDSAITFSDLIMTVLDEVNGVKGVSLQLSLTGHSLGAWLAQVTAFTLEYMQRDGDGFVKRHDRSHDRHVHTVTFDTPGCGDMLKTIIDHGYCRYRETVSPDRLDITNYLAPPNRINTAGSHAGTIRVVTLDLSEFGRMDKHTPCYTKATHAIDNFVKAFEGEAASREVLDWPESSGALGGGEYNEVHKTASHATGYVPDPEIEKNQEKTWLLELRYKTEELGSSCNLRVFSQQELYLLELWSALKTEKVKMNRISQFVNRHNLGTVEDLLAGFEINLDKRSMICQSKESLQAVIRRSKQLMRWFHPEFLAAVQRQSAQLPKVGPLIYQMAVKNYLDSLPECQMYFEDTVGLNVFLESREARILHIESEDGQLQVAVLHNLLSRMREIPQPEHCLLDTYLRPERQTFVNIGQMRDLDRTVDFDSLYESGYSGDDLLIVDSTLASPDFEIIENFTRNAHKKLILISSPQTDCTRSLESLNVSFTTVPRAQLGFSDLTEESQRQLFSRKMLIVGGKQFALEDYTNIINVRRLLSHIDSCIDRQNFKQIVTDQKFTLKMEDPLLGQDDLKVHSTVNKEVNMTRVARALHTHSPDAVLLISGIGEEELGTGRWRELVRALGEGRTVHTAGDGEPIFKKMCREEPSATIYWFSASPESMHCKSIYQNRFYMKRRFHKPIFDVEQFACKINTDVNIRNATFVFQTTNGKRSLVSRATISVRNKNSFLETEHVKVAATAEEVGDIMRANPGRAVHVLKQETIGGLILWQRSRGSFDGLRPYVSTDTGKSVDEEELRNTNRKVVVIADEPGMGKSTSLTSVSRLLRSSAWVIRVDLKDHQIPHFPSELSLNLISEFILRDSDSWLRGLLQFCLNKDQENSRDIYIFFDGFDEIKRDSSTQYSAEDQVLRLLKYLHNETTARVWVTTRVYRREILENALSTVAMRFKRISKRRQREYLVEFWHPHLLLELDRYGDAEKVTLEKCAELLYDNAKQVLGNDVQNFMGIPLQMRMLAEVFTERVKKCVESGIGSETDIRNTFDVKSVLELYQQFVSLKYEIYFNDKTGLNAGMSSEIKRSTVELFTENHRMLGFRTLFPEFAKRHFEALEAGWEVELCRIGLVQAGGVGAENAEFVHRTLAEYFCADLAVHWLRNRGRYRGHAPVVELLLVEILLLDSHKVIRTFIDKLVLSQPLAEEADRFSALQISALWCDEGKQRTLFNKDINTALHTAVLEGNTGIIAILVGGLMRAPVPEGLIGFIAAHDRDRYTALGLAAREAGNEEAPETVRRVNTEIMKEFVHSVENCPHEVILELLLATYARYTTILVDKIQLLGEYVRGEAVCPAIREAFTRTREIIPGDIRRLQAAVAGCRVGEVAQIYGDMESDTERRYMLLAPGGGGSAGGTVLHQAAHSGEYGGLNEIPTQITVTLCNQNIPEVGRSYDGAGLTPLHCAARAGRLDIVEHFINHGVCIDSLAKEGGGTALSQAVLNGRLPVVKYLVEKGLPANSLHSEGEAALCTAATTGNLPVVEYLVKKGLVDVNSVNEQGETALFIGAQNGSLPMVKYLVEKRLADIHTVNNEGETALFAAAQYENLPVVQYLMEKGIAITTLNCRNETALFSAAEGGSLPLMQYLVERGIAINTLNNEGETALFSAAREKNLPIVRYLIEKGISINTVNDKGETALFSAACDGNLPIVRYLVDSGIAINTRNDTGETALFCATRNRSLPIVQYLIEKGIATNTLNNKGETALFSAASDRSLPIARLLIEKGVPINTLNYKGETVLFSAACNWSLSMMQYLIEEEISINTLNYKGETALFSAAKYGSLSEVEYLVEVGLDITTENSEGETALDIASEYDHRPVMEFLKRKLSEQRAPHPL